MDALLEAMRREEEFRKQFEIEDRFRREFSMAKELRRMDALFKPNSVLDGLMSPAVLRAESAVVEELRRAEETRKQFLATEAAHRQAAEYREEATRATLVREERENQAREDLVIQIREADRLREAVGIAGYSPPEPPRLDMSQIVAIYAPPRSEPLVPAPSPVPDEATGWQRFNAFLNHQAKEHGIAWGLAAFLVSVILALLAL